MTTLVAKSCCQLPPVSSNYQGKGKTEKIGGIDVYVGGNPPASPTSAVVLIYDIFGLHPNAYQVCDVLSSQLQAKGLATIVVIPDFFRGEPYPIEKFPPKDWTVFQEWLGVKGNFEKVVRPDLQNVVSWLKGKGVTKFGTVGFCWGGKMAILSSQVPTLSVVCASLIHPAFIEKADLQKSTVPLCILPSKEEDDFVPLMDELKGKPFFSKCIHQRFDDMHHGWVGARGDWSDATQAKRATEAIQIFANFFESNL